MSIFKRPKKPVKSEGTYVGYEQARSFLFLIDHHLSENPAWLKAVSELKADGKQIEILELHPEKRQKRTEAKRIYAQDQNWLGKWNSHLNLEPGPYDMATIVSSFGHPKITALHRLFQSDFWLGLGELKEVELDVAIPCKSGDCSNHLEQLFYYIKFINKRENARV